MPRRGFPQLPLDHRALFRPLRTGPADQAAIHQVRRTGLHPMDSYGILEWTLGARQDREVAKRNGYGYRATPHQRWVCSQ